MKRVLVLVSLLLLLLTAAASAEYKSKITYHEWDANSLSFDLAYVLASGSQIGLDVSSAALPNGASRKDSERWFFTYSLNREFNWRLGAVYTRSMNLTQDTDGWKRDESQTSLRPLVGISLERPVYNELEVRLQADVFRSHDNREIGSRVVGEAFFKGLSIGYTIDSDEAFTGPHIAYEFHIF